MNQDTEDALRHAIDGELRQAQPASEAQQLHDARVANDLLRGWLQEQERIVGRQRTALDAALAYEVEHNGLLGEQQDRLRAGLGLPPVEPIPITQAFAELRAAANGAFDGVDVDEFMREVRTRADDAETHALYWESQYKRAFDDSVEQRLRAQWAEQERDALLARAATLERQCAESEEEIATLAFAAHMDADYAYGLPTWINMVLYAAYIGFDIGPHNRKWATRISERYEMSMLQIRDASNALHAAGIDAEPHEPHEGCTTQLGHRVRALAARVTEYAQKYNEADDELIDLRYYRTYWEPQISELGDLYTAQGGELATLTQLARDLVASLHGDGNGRCWAGAKEADRLRGWLERVDGAAAGGGAG